MEGCTTGFSSCSTPSPTLAVCLNHLGLRGFCFIYIICSWHTQVGGAVAVSPQILPMMQTAGTLHASPYLGCAERLQSQGKEGRKWSQQSPTWATCLAPAGMVTRGTSGHMTAMGSAGLPTERHICHNLPCCHDYRVTGQPSSSIWLHTQQPAL